MWIESDSEVWEVLGDFCFTVWDFNMNLLVLFFSLPFDMVLLKNSLSTVFFSKFAPFSSSGDMVAGLCLAFWVAGVSLMQVQKVLFTFLLLLYSVFISNKNWVCCPRIPRNPNPEGQELSVEGGVKKKTNGWVRRYTYFCGEDTLSLLLPDC